MPALWRRLRLHRGGERPRVQLPALWRSSQAQIQKERGRTPVGLGFARPDGRRNSPSNMVQSTPHGHYLSGLRPAPARAASRVYQADSRRVWAGVFLVGIDLGLLTGVCLLPDRLAAIGQINSNHWALYWRSANHPDGAPGFAIQR